MIIGKLIPAGTGMSRYRNIQVKIKEESIPEYWLQRQREVAKDTGEPAMAAVSMTREEAERALGGGGTADAEE